MAIKSGKRALFALTMAASFSMVSGAWAQSNTVLAQSLFEQGRKLMDKGDYEHGCPKLAESQRLDPGTGTLLNLGICYEKAGKTASAWATFEEARSAARKEGDEQRQKFAGDHSEKLRPLISKLTLEVASEDKPAGFKVTVDGNPMSSAVWGTAVAMDPGKHRVEASAPGRRPWSTMVEIGEKADRKLVKVPALAPEAAASTPPAKPTPVVSKEPTKAPQQQATSAAMDSSSVQGGSSPTLGYIIGGAGLVALGAGSYFGLQAMSSWKSRNDECDDTGCSDRGIAFGDDTNRQANIANVAIGVGLVGVGVGAYLVLTSSSSAPQESAKSHVRVAPVVGSNGGGLSVQGAW